MKVDRDEMQGEFLDENNNTCRKQSLGAVRNEQSNTPKSTPA